MQSPADPSAAFACLCLAPENAAFTYSSVGDPAAASPSPSATMEGSATTGSSIASAASAAPSNMSPASNSSAIPNTSSSLPPSSCGQCCTHKHLSHRKISINQYKRTHRRSAFGRPEDWRPSILECFACHISPIVTLGSNADLDYFFPHLLMSGSESADATTSTNNVSSEGLPCNLRIQGTIQSLWQTMSRSKKRQISRQLFSLLIDTYCPGSAKDSLDPCPGLIIKSRHVVNVRPMSLYRLPTRPLKLIAYMQDDWLWERRHNRFQSRKDNTMESNLKASEFANMDFDPYYAGLLLAMAQHGRVPKGNDVMEVHILSPTKDFICMMQYTARISPQYLRRFDEPHVAFDSCLTIERKKLPLREPQLLADALSSLTTANLASTTPSLSPVLPQRPPPLGDITNADRLAAA